jgi:uncharacterized protein
MTTAIYFLLNGTDFSALRRIRQDEVWHFYDGSPAAIHVIDADGKYCVVLLGRNWQAGQVPQAVVKAGCLVGARVTDTQSYTLVRCTVALGFDFDDVEMPSRAELCRLYPQHKPLIEGLTHQGAVG